MLTQVEIAQKIGTTRQAVQAYLSGNRRAGPRMAKKLEKATGIDRLAWMYPGEMDNPYLKKDNKDVASPPERPPGIGSVSRMGG